MHIFPFSLPNLMLLLCTLLLAPPQLMAANDAMAPPEVTDDVEVSSDRVEERMDPAANLHDELNAPDSNTGVDVRSYKRKDGTVITEYGPKGKVFEIKVQPPGGMPAYYLYRNAGGEFERRLPGGATRIVPPSWILKEF
ncbi:MAG: DUF2782 domain-containing protein [Mariprofundus sp.]|nr:DUF2782 domain-containing protein [Mariprofundus sp.]